MNNIQLMEIIQQYKDHSATAQDVENAVKEFEADVKKQAAPSQQASTKQSDEAAAEDYAAKEWKTRDGHVLYAMDYTFCKKDFIAGCQHVRQQQKDGWISVQDRTPDLIEGKDYSENVFAILDGDLAVMCFAWTPGEYEEGGGYYWANCYDINGDPEWDDDYNPTHWQPLPALPK